VADEVDDVGAGERFTAREISLQDAGGSSFFENARPDFGGELVRARLQLERIRTVDAMERAAVGEFSDESERVGRSWCHVRKQNVRLGRRPLQLEVQGALFLQESKITEDVLLDFVRLGFRINLLQVRDDLVDGMLAVAALDDFEAGAVEA
jgi:hypothetical protein